MDVRKLPFREALVTFCCFMYLLLLLPERAAAAQGGGPMWLEFSPTTNALRALGATGVAATRACGRWETLLTAIFLHGSVLHLLFNCLWTWQLAPAMEQLYDRTRFFLIFVVSGVLGNLLSVLVSESAVLVGASGGVYGLFGSLVWYGFKRRGILGSTVLRFGLFWAGLGIVLSLSLPHVAFWAHVGGFVAGFGCGALFSYEELRQSGPWLGLAAVIITAATLLSFACFLIFPPAGLGT
jgi:rhomboid protease GluP